QSLHRFLLNYASFDLAKRTFKPVGARSILRYEISTFGHPDECRERQRRIEVVVGVNLFRRDQDLWTNIAVALVDQNVIDGDNRFESKLDLGPHECVFKKLQARFRIIDKLIDVTQSGIKRTLSFCQAYLIALVVVLNQRRLAARSIVFDIFKQHLSEQIRYSCCAICPVPVDLFAKPFDHRCGKFYLALPDHTLFQIFDIAWFKCESFKIADRWLASEGADFEDRGVALPRHTLAVRSEKLVSRGVNIHQTRNGDFGFV